MSSLEDISELFDTETEKLESAINAGLRRSLLLPSEIIPIYYQTMNVISLITLLNQQFENLNTNSSLILKIHKVQKLISEKFNSNLHKSIMLQLENSITNTTKELHSVKIRDKSKHEIEAEAKLYEKLRQMMSTKEFVEQYDKGLSND